jgi:uncharacterized OB-fold protein
MWADSEPIYRQATASPARTHRTRHSRYRLVGSRCDACNLDFFPPRLVCPQCRSRKLSDAPFAMFGVVVEFGEDHTPLMGHNGRSRRSFALIRLDDGPVVLGELVDIEFDEVRVGVGVEAVLRKWRRESNGLYQYGYKFRPRIGP